TGGNIVTTRTTFCDGVTRRDLLRLGTGSLFGLGLTLPRLLQLEAAAPPVPRKRGVSLIYLFLHGGLSTVDTLDLKPAAPAEFRGEFKPAKTCVPGMDICELLPKLAQQADKFSLVRSFRHHNSDHGPADHYILTGYFPQAGFNPNLSPNNQRPAHGSILARKLGPRGAVARYVVLRAVHPSAGPAMPRGDAAPHVLALHPDAAGCCAPGRV